MRRLLPDLTGALVLSAMLAGAPASAEIRWHTDIAMARREAAARNQPVLLDFWASWCGPCSEMDKEVFSQERVVAAMRKVWPVRVDIDRQPATARQYRVEATPTLIVTDSLGNELFHHRGQLTADQLVSLIEALPGDLSRVNALAAIVARDKENTEALRALGDELRIHQLYVASADFYRRALKTRGGRDRTPLRVAILLGLCRNQALLRQFEEAEKTLSQLEREFPQDPEAAAFRRELVAIRGAR